MNYKEYIEGLNLESLKILVDSHGIDYLNTPDWNGDELSTLKKALSKTFTKAGYVEDMLAQLDEHQKNIIRIIFFSDEAVDQDSVIRKFNNLYGKDYNPRNIIDSLWRMGLVIKFEMYYRNRPYIALVDDVRLIASRFVVQELLGEWAGGDLDVYVNSNPFELAQDIYVFLSYINNNETKLTAKNVIFRKSAQKIEELFIEKSEYMDEPETEYSERFNFINNFLYMIDMITYNEGNVYLNHAKNDSWLNIKLMDKVKVVSGFLETYYLGNKREITDAVNKIKLILLNTYDTPISIISFEAIIEKYHADMNFNYLRSNFKKILNHLVLIGMVEFMTDSENNMFFRLNKYGWAFYSNRTEIINEEEENHFYIQPNFEIIATVNLNPVLRWELDRFCDIGKIEKTIHYWITKTSIHRALSNEKNIDDLLSFLKAHSKSGVPQNVEYTLKEWSASYGNVYLVDMLLLRCRTPELAAEISSIQSMSENIIGKVTDKDLILKKTFGDDALDILVKKGYIAKPQISEPDVSFAASKKEHLSILDEIFGQDNNQDGIDLSQFNIDPRYLDKNAHYKKTIMDLKPPAKGETAKPSASKVYSPSTYQAKEILEKAMSQKKPVLIDYYQPKTDSSKKIRIEPLKIEKAEKGWMVYASSNNQNLIFDMNKIQSIEFTNLN
ncbi:MAG: helicase-associated domain-containing protein [Deltaproteobacteria bacterium]